MVKVFVVVVTTGYYGINQDDCQVFTKEDAAFKYAVSMMRKHHLNDPTVELRPGSFEDFEIGYSDSRKGYGVMGFEREVDLK